MAKRVALVCGHGGNPYDPGSCGNGYKEAEVARKIGDSLYAKLKGKVDVYLYNKNNDLYKVKDWSKFTKNDEVIEIHLNATAGAQGTETLIKNGYKADTLDNALQNTMMKYFKDRGIKQRSDLGNMNNFAKLGISYRLIEVCFIDNKSEMTTLMNKFDTIMTDIANAIIKAVGGSGTASSGGSATTSGSGGTTATKTLYRVRKNWADASSQKGAYESLTNAKACADKNPGYSVFDANGKSVYTSKSGSVSSAFKEYQVEVTAKDLYIRPEPVKNDKHKGFINPGVYTIVEEKNGYGKLKSGAGWISLSYAKKIK